MQIKAIKTTNTYNSKTKPFCDLGLTLNHLKNVIPNTNVIVFDCQTMDRLFSGTYQNAYKSSKVQGLLDEYKIFRRWEIEGTDYIEILKTNATYYTITER